MRPSTIWYTLKQGFKNIKRNWMFSLACIITMAACIFLVGIFYSIVNNVNSIAHKVEEEVPITVFFDEGTTEEEIQAVGAAIQARPEVARMDYQSADQAWEDYKQKYFGDEDAADGFKDDNPLANSSNYQVSAVWQQESMRRAIKVHWKEERLHLRYLEMVWISAILHPAVGFIGGFRRRTEGSSVSMNLGPEAGLIIFRQGTGSSADLQTWCL